MKSHSFVLLVAVSAACMGGQAYAAQTADDSVAMPGPGEASSTPIGHHPFFVKGGETPALHAIPSVMGGPNSYDPMWRVGASPGDGHVIHLRGDEFILPRRIYRN